MRLAKALLLILLFLEAFPVVPTYAQSCGGTERWQVKVGTDSGVSSVDLVNTIPIDVPGIIALPEPQLPAPGDNDTRLASETHVYVLTGHLAEFKLEASGDQDFHMVITDDTLTFTGDSGGTQPGHSLVAEIPDSNCIPGAHGDPSVPSRFDAQIRSARQELLTQFPNADMTGAFNNAGGIPVRIVGVGFFDFPHGQTGRAPNNVELHPVLDITFNPAGSAGSFSLSASPLSLSVMQGASGTSTVSATITGTFNSAISLSAAGLPAGATAVFSPNSIAAPGSGSSVLTVSVPPTVPAGTYPLTITGVGAGQSQASTTTLSVTAGDTTPPTTSVSAPADGATASGTVNVAATASDNVGVVKAEIYIDGAIKACNVGATSISYPWDTTTISNGPHTVVSKAYDAAGNVGTSSTVTVTVSN